MKKFLLVLFCLGAAFAGRSQVIFNELYTDPGSGNNEFFELYNTSIDPNPISLDCYTMVTLYTVTYKNGPNKGKTYSGAYVLDFPNVSIKPKQWLIGVSASPFNVQKATGITKPATDYFNWNSLSSSTGSLKKYQLNTSNTDAASLNNASFVDVTNDANFGLEANLNDFLPDISSSAIGGGIQYAFFLFNNGAYVNGFIGKSATTTIPSVISKLKSLTYTTSCGTYTLDWSTLKNAENQGNPPGPDNGYARTRDGACGTWVKTASPQSGSVYTPDAQNGSATGSTAGYLTTNEKLICNTKINFQITATTDQSAIPVIVELYEDNGTPNVLDQLDVLKDFRSITSIPTSPADPNTSFTLPDPTKKYLIVYKTNLGCLDKVSVSVAPTYNVNSIYRNICGNKVDFDVTSISSDLLSFGIPITANVYADLAPVGTLGANDVFMGSKEFSSLGSYSVPILKTPIDYSSTPMLLQYTSPNVCYTSAALVVTDLAPVATSVTYSCNTFTIRVTPPDAISARYSTGMKIDVYSDKPKAEVLGPNDKLITSFTAPTLTAGVTTSFPFVINTPSFQGKSILVVFTLPNASLPDASCITPDRLAAPYTQSATNAPINSKGWFPTSDEVSEAPVSYKLNATTNPNAYPITVLVYEDINSNNKIDNSDIALDAPLVINQAPVNPENTSYTTTNSYPGQYNVIVRFLGTCITEDLLIAAGTQAPLPVTFKSFNAVRKDDSKVNVTWTTAMEQNNRGFHVQRNTGSGWKDVAFVFSQASEGTSTQELSYTFTDLNPTKGVSQYRVLQVDLDGKGRYSNIASVRGTGAAARLLLFPNPSATGSVTLLFDSEGARDITVADVTGRVVQQYRNVAAGSLDVKNLSNGFYTVQVRDAATGAVTIEKFIIKKR